MKTTVDYFKGRKTEFAQLFRTYHRTPEEANIEEEKNHYRRGIPFCEWYVTIDGNIDFGEVNPLNKNGSVNWDHLNNQVAEFIADFKERGGKKILVEITSRNTQDGLLDNHYVTGDYEALEG